MQSNLTTLKESFKLKSEVILQKSYFTLTTFKSDTLGKHVDYFPFPSLCIKKGVLMFLFKILGKIYFFLPIVIKLKIKGCSTASTLYSL